MQSAAVGVWLFLIIFLIIIAILWIALPFLILGTNRRLDKLIAQNEKLLQKARDS